MFPMRRESQVSTDRKGHLQVEDALESLSHVPRSVMIGSFE